MPTFRYRLIGVERAIFSLICLQLSLQTSVYYLDKKLCLTTNLILFNFKRAIEAPEDTSIVFSSELKAPAAFKCGMPHLNLLESKM